MIKQHELIVDSFAGGGGASSGIEMALGRPVDIAINHDPAAISMHEANHPMTKHYCESVWDVDPKEATKGRPVGVAWFSPDCKHFSKAKGGKPVDNKIRGLAWIVLRWASAVKPRVIFLENVEEFKDWCPLDKSNKPIKPLKGATFQLWKSHLEALGYRVEYRILKACDYGAPTIRKRLFVVARRDGEPIVWPEPTHGEGLKPYKTAASIIDWSLPCPSIYLSKEAGKVAGVRRPLAEATMKRIYAGVERYVTNTSEPFILPHNLAVPFITEHANASSQRNMPADEPLRTICSQVKGGHFALVSAFLVKYYGADKDGASIFDPLHTIATRDRFGLVVVNSEQYKIVDIGMRMLTPRELFNAQGFKPDYIIDTDKNGAKVSKKNQVARCGNSVSPEVASALVAANLTNAKIKLNQSVAF